MPKQQTEDVAEWTPMQQLSLNMINTSKHSMPSYPKKPLRHSRKRSSTCYGGQPQIPETDEETIFSSINTFEIKQKQTVETTNDQRAFSKFLKQ